MRTSPLPFLRAAAGLWALSLGFLIACSDDLRIKTYGSAKPACSEEADDCPSIERTKPLVAKPGTAVSVLGKNFSARTQLLLDGTKIEGTFVDANTIEFEMPEGKSGFADLTVTNGGKRLALSSDTVKVYRRADAGYPVMTAGPAFICSGVQFLDGEGAIQIGTKICAPPPLCENDGEVDCMANATYAAALTTQLADKVVSGQTVAGVSGSVVLPAASDVRSGITFGSSSGATGTLTLPPAAAVRVSAGAYGPGGNSIIPLLADCSSDGQTGCITLGPSYAAAVVAGAADKIIAGQSLAGVSGNVSLPAASKVLMGTNYGIAGLSLTGSLSLPSANSVLSGSPAYGEPGAQLTPSYSPDFPSAANVRASDTVNGIAGSLSDCNAANQMACVATATFKTMNLAAAGTDTSLSAANFNTTIATGTNFEFWDASGARHSVAGDTDLVSSKILTGETIFGVSGSLPATPPDCTAANQSGCVATTTYKTMNLAAAGSGAALTASNFNSQIKTAGDFEFWDATGARHAVAGDLDLTAVNVKDSITIFGTTGNLTGAPANCTSDGQSNCLVDGSTYAAGALTGAASKILSGQTLAGVPGNVTLPAIGKVFAGINYGVSGSGLTGTLTLPLANTVLTGSGAYGDPGAQLTPSYSPDFPAVSNVLSTDTVDSVNGTLTLPLAAKVLTGTTYGVGGNGSTGSLTLPAAANVLTGSGTYGETGSLLTPSYSPDFPALANVRSGDTVNGASGTLNDCSSDGAIGCVVVGPTYAALLKTGAEDKIISGQTIGSVSGNVTLPLVGKVFLGTSYGVSGTGSTGTLTLPAAASVLTGSGAYGDPGAQLTPAYSPDFPAVGNVLSSDTVAGAAGTLTLPLAAKVLTGTSYGVAGNGSTGTLTLPAAANVLTGSGTYGETGSLLTPSYSPDFPAASNVLSTATVNSVSGTLTLPLAAKVLTGTSYGVGGNGSTGSLTLPAAASVLTGSGTYGETGSLLTPSYNPDFPAVGNVLSSDTVNGAAGTLTLPLVSKVLTGTSYGASGNGSTGTLTLPAASNVLTGSGAYGEPGSQLTPSYSPDFPTLANVRTIDTVNGAAGTLADCSAANQADCVATATYKTMNLSAMGTDTGLTAANFQTRIATAANSEFWDATGARHSITGDADLSVDKVKSGVVIHGVTGQYPSASYPLASNTAATDLTLFTTQLTTDGSFEFFDSAGAKYTGSGDNDLVNSNIKNAIAIENLSLTGNYVATLTCPTGWIKVPGDSAYGTSDFCVMKYEAKNVSTVATSQAASTPWVSITQTASITSCRALGTGYDLISNPQWMTIGANVAGINGNWSGGTVGSGSLFAGHNDTSPNSACAAPSNDTDFYVETNCTAVSSGDTAEQRRTLTLSNSNVIWDLSGNVWEWVNYMNVGDKPNSGAAWTQYTAVTGTTTTALKDLVPTNAVKAFWSNAWNSTQWIGQYYPGTNGSGGALLRGGGWFDGSYTGVFTAYLNSAPSASNTTVGLRCSLAGPSL